MACALAVAVTLATVASCRRPSEAVKSDLEQAGYQLTAADWLRAARGNDTPALKKFLATGFAADSLDDAGDSALHAAAAAGAKDSADFLLNHGLAVDLRGSMERTPLMAAVLGGQTEMTRWLLRQGADPRAKDKEGFSPLMLAVREGQAGAVAEIAPYHRESLDSALLLASLLGQTGAIDTLTNYGASVYARMEDGRTPLMIAAQNGHADAVKLLLDLGASRFTTDRDGHDAAALATSAGHPEIAALLAREPLPADLALASPVEVASAMEAFVDARAAGDPEVAAADAAATMPPSRPIQGEVLSATTPETEPEPETATLTVKNPAAPAAKTFALPPIVMRHYRESELPVIVHSVQGETAKLEIRGNPPREIEAHPGDAIPGTRFVVVSTHRRMQSSKLNLGREEEVSVVTVKDTANGATREWISGLSASAHDPVALVEDATTHRRYTATTGQRFKSADGTEFIISDVRPNQLVIEEAATGAVRTLPLRGPRG